MFSGPVHSAHSDKEMHCWRTPAVPGVRGCLQEPPLSVALLEVGCHDGKVSWFGYKLITWHSCAGDSAVLYVWEVQVEDRAQRKGLGRFLMQLLELLARKCARTLCCSRAVLKTVDAQAHCRTNTPAGSIFIPRPR